MRSEVREPKAILYKTRAFKVLLEECMRSPTKTRRVPFLEGGVAHPGLSWSVSNCTPLAHWSRAGGDSRE